MKIIVSGPATAFENDSDEEVADPRRLSELHGLHYSDDLCTTYLDGELEEIGLIGGAIRLSFEGPAGPLKVITEYQSPRRLKPAELKKLVEETVGQWSDGIGESEFAHRDRLGLNVDLFPVAGKAAVEQIDDGVKIPAPKKNPIFKAIKDGLIDRVRKAIAAGASVNDGKEHGDSPLHAACLRGKCDIALLLVEHGADVSARNGECRTPLAYLAMANVSEDQYPAVVAAAEVLLTRGATLEAEDSDGRTPLMWAVNRGKHSLISLLLDRGAQINAVDQGGGTALMYAQDVDSAKILLERGVDPSVRNKSGLDAAEHALHNKHWRQSAELAAVIRSAMGS